VAGVNETQPRAAVLHLAMLHGSFSRLGSFGLKLGLEVFFAFIFDHFLGSEWL
jgi:hypothetical protein